MNPKTQMTVVIGTAVAFTSSLVYLQKYFAPYYAKGPEGLRLRAKNSFSKYNCLSEDSKATDVNRA
eukprot:CAMPEP_0184289806 /NCGR_PEP_ID=MMETSP1049-20130417/2174_1 /TAXON_ID=77928 /ORGANISM="Proteomonas sulcata, Strain CCMP704" /LENGTH=65 /DNA_ID=CAMNT_0026596735 /DNA_START=36 /DNA_END=233 /DNA_ORIENTATION=+